MIWTAAKKCPNCWKPTAKASTERYVTQKDLHVKTIFARICDNCKIIYLNPDLKDYEIIKDSELGK